MRFQGFGEGAVRFFEDLAANNTRDWWRANKDWYERDVRAPLEHLLDDLQAEFGEAKVFRPNRDTRFSKDKSPYKTSAAAVVFDPVAGDHTLYVQLSADGLMVGGGNHMPATDQLARLRAAIDADDTGSQLEAIVARIRGHGGEVGAHDELKTAPRGYGSDHPRIELLRYKGITGWFEHPAEPWLHTTKARDTVAEDWRALGPLNAWLAANVGRSTPAD
jgi:uncharacterized protein (TIGR02453 family)